MEDEGKYESSSSDGSEDEVDEELLRMQAELALEEKKLAEAGGATAMASHREAFLSNSEAFQSGFETRVSHNKTEVKNLIAQQQEDMKRVIKSALDENAEVVIRATAEASRVKEEVAKNVLATSNDADSVNTQGADIAAEHIAKINR